MEAYRSFPILTNLKDFSLLLNISEYTIYKMTRKPEKYYKLVTIPKKDGNERLLACPSMKMKAIQAWILRNILEKLETKNCATAFKLGQSVYHNVSKHKGNEYFICLDIIDFFGSIHRSKVYSLFKNIGYNQQAATILTNLCTFNGGLPQGGVTSPALSNLINNNLDEKISSYCSLEHIVYSRYADDITLSCNNPKKLLKAKDFVETALKEEGYSIKVEKTRMLKPGVCRRITGLIYNEEHEIRIGKKRKRILRSKIHHLESTPLDSDEYRERLLHIQGWLSYLKNVDRTSYNQLVNYWRNIKKQKQFSEVAATKNINT